MIFIFIYYYNKQHILHLISVKSYIVRKLKCWCISLTYKTIFLIFYYDLFFKTLQLTPKLKIEVKRTRLTIALYIFIFIINILKLMKIYLFNCQYIILFGWAIVLLKLYSTSDSILFNMIKVLVFDFIFYFYFIKI